MFYYGCELLCYVYSFGAILDGGRSIVDPASCTLYCLAKIHAVSVVITPTWLLTNQPGSHHGIKGYIVLLCVVIGCGWTKTNCIVI